ncbi:hypothetical protein ACFL2B_01750 [Patescibacteria group bacterium]
MSPGAGAFLLAADEVTKRLPPAAAAGAIGLLGFGDKLVFGLVAKEGLGWLVNDCFGVKGVLSLKGLADLIGGVLGLGAMLGFGAVGLGGAAGFGALGVVKLGVGLLGSAGRGGTGLGADGGLGGVGAFGGVDLGLSSPKRLPKGLSSLLSESSRGLKFGIELFYELSI